MEYQLLKYAYQSIAITCISNEALIDTTRKIYYNYYLLSNHVSVYYINKYILLYLFMIFYRGHQRSTVEKGGACSIQTLTLCMLGNYLSVICS